MPAREEKANKPTVISTTSQKKLHYTHYFTPAWAAHDKGFDLYNALFTQLRLQLLLYYGTARYRASLNRSTYRLF